MREFTRILHATRLSVADEMRPMKIKCHADATEEFFVLDQPMIPKCLAAHWIPVFWDILWKTGRWPVLEWVHTEWMDDCYYAEKGYWKPV